MPYKDKEKQREAQRKYAQSEKGKKYYKEYHKNNPPTEEAKQKHKEWAKSEAGRLSSKKRQMKYNYGVEYEDYLKMIEAQSGLCDICGEPFQGEPCIDHDHKTGKVRALLCSGCNIGLGNFRDKPSLLRRAAEYLERHKDV